MEGRKPKPNHLKILDGNPGKTKIKEDPKPPEGMPEPPPHLDAYALEEWNRHAPGLNAMGMLSPVDSSTFGAYCMAYSRWRTAEEQIKLRVDKMGALAGLVEETKQGTMIKNALVTVARQSAEDMVKFGADFGLSAIARTRLAVDTGAKTKSKFEGLIGGKK